MVVSTRSLSRSLKDNLQVRTWLFPYNLFHYPLPSYPKEQRPQDWQQRQKHWQRQVEGSCFDRAETGYFATVGLVSPTSPRSICLELTHSGYCCLEFGKNTRCMQLAADLCPSPFNPAVLSISKGTGKIITFPTTTSTLPMDSLDAVSTQSSRKAHRGSTPQRPAFSQSDALGKGGSTPSVTSGGPGGQPIETDVIVPTLTEPTCDDNGCCTFPPSWTACQGGYLTQVNEDILASTPTPYSEPSGEPPSQTTPGLDETRETTPMFLTSTSKIWVDETFVVVQAMVISNQEAETNRARLDFTTITPVHLFPTPSHYRISLDGQCGVVADTTCDGSYFGYCCGPDSK